MEDANDGEVRGEIGMLHVAQAICGGVNRAIETASGGIEAY